MVYVEHTVDGLRIHQACPAGIDLLTTELAPDGRWYALSGGGYTVHRWELGSERPQGAVFHTQHSFGTVKSLASARMSDGGGVVTGRSSLDELWRWDLATGEPIGLPAKDRSLWSRTPGPPPLAVVESADGPTMITDLEGGGLQRWDAGALVNGSLPGTLRAVYDDEDRGAAMVLGEPDGGIVIRPLPDP